MPFLAAAIAVALLAVQDPPAQKPPWPAQGAMDNYDLGAARSQPLKEETLEVEDPNNKGKKIFVKVYTFVSWGLANTNIEEVGSTEIARTCSLNSGKTTERVSLNGEAYVRGVDGMAMNLHFALQDKGLDPAALMPGILERFNQWAHLPETLFMKEPAVFDVTWNPHADNNPKAVVEHDVGYGILNVPMTVSVVRQYKIGDQVYSVDRTPIQTECVRYVRIPKREPIATRVIVPEDKAAEDQEDNRTGFFSCPGQEGKLGGVSYAGGFTGLLAWPGGDVGSVDLKYGGMELGDYWGGFAGGSSSGAVFTGDGMNRVGFNPGAIMAGLGTISMPDEMFFPGGTLFVPSDPRYQILMSGQNYCFRREIAGGKLMAAIAPRIQEEQGYSLCAQMNKLEPNKSVSYIPVQPPNSVYHALAKISDAAFFKGPAEQARLWIYTNKASFTQINSKLRPGITARQYVNCAYDVFRVGGFAAADLENSKLFEPRLLAASGAEPNASSWFMDRMIRMWPKEVRAELTKPGMDLTDLVKVGADAKALKAAADMTAYLLEYGNSDVRIGALTYLLAVPDQNVEAMKGLKPVRLGVAQSSNNEEEKKLLAQVKARYGH